MVTNYITKRLNDWNNGDDGKQQEAFPAYFTLGHFGNIPSDITTTYPYWTTIQAMFHHGTILVILFYSIILRRSLKALE